MEKKTIKKGVYIAYVLLLIIFLGGALLAPLLAFKDEKIAVIIYETYAPTCHQKLSRSFCIFDNNVVSIRDCTPQTGEFILNDNKIIKSNYNGKIGYKMAICSRDIGLYGAMLLAALVYPFIRKWDNANVPPAIYFMAAIIPIGLDGGLQFLGTLHILSHYESTNIIRFITGGIAGIAITFYLIPLAMSFIEK